MVDQADNRSDPNLPQKRETSVVPVPSRRIKRLRRYVLPKDRVTQRSDTKIVDKIQIAFPIQMTSLQHLIAIIISEASHRAFEAAPDSDWRAPIKTQALSSTAALATSSERLLPSFSSIRRKVAKACPTT